MLKNLIDYLVQDLGVQPNVAVTIILSIFTFSLGFIITWIAAAISKWIKRKNYKKSLTIIIKHFLESCRKQYLLLEPFSSQKGFLHGENYNISVKSNFAQNYLSTLDIKIFIENFSSFFNKTRAQEIADFFEIVETVKTSKETAKEQIKTYYSNYDENLKKYNDGLDGLRKLQDDLALEYNGKTIDSQLENYIFSIVATFTKWKQGGSSTNIHVTNTEIVTPLFDTALSLPPNPISRKVIDHCIQCRIAVENISNVGGYMKDEIETLKKVHKDSYERGTTIFNKW
jgi:hypothetical protein